MNKTKTLRLAFVAFFILLLLVVVLLAASMQGTTPKQSAVTPTPQIQASITPIPTDDKQIVAYLKSYNKDNQELILETHKLQFNDCSQAKEICVDTIVDRAVLQTIKFKVTNSIKISLFNDLNCKYANTKRTASFNDILISKCNYFQEYGFLFYFSYNGDTLTNLEEYILPYI
jgi:hypothetical protein